MESSNGRKISPSNKHIEPHNNILNPGLDQTQTHPSFLETATVPSTSASPSIESQASIASDSACDPATKSRDHKIKQDSNRYGIAKASSATEDPNQHAGKPLLSNQLSTDSHKSKKTVKINQIDLPAEGAPAEEKPELLSIPQTNFAIGLLVMCCFNPPFGLLALYFSLRAAAAYRDGNKTKGSWFARTSIVVSLLGIMVTMVIITSVVLYIAVNKNNARKAKRSGSNTLGF